MKFVILGHSYVKKLPDLNITKFEVDNITVRINYFGFDGETYNEWRPEV